jgi:hypothetical protein
MLGEILALGLLAFIAWFWFDSLRARERATRTARRLCSESDVQLLDETVALEKVWLGRDHSGKIQPCRIYLFDYVDIEEQRCQGVVATVGAAVREAKLTKTSHSLLH